MFIEMGESLLNSSCDVLESCKADLLTALRQEGSDFVRKELCDVVAKLARICTGERQELYELLVRVICFVEILLGLHILHYH